MSASTVHRPTENTAIGRVHDRVLAGADRLWALLAHAVRRHDHAGARVQASGQVGAA